MRAFSLLRRLGSEWRPVQFPVQIFPEGPADSKRRRHGACRVFPACRKKSARANGQHGDEITMRRARCPSELLIAS
jgi:hypothetical protein